MASDSSQQQQIIDTLVAGLKDQTDAIIASQPKRAKTIAERKVKSVYNPTGKKRVLAATVYQNGRRLEEPTLFDREIALLGKLKPGRYLGNRVQVRQNMNDLPDLTFYIAYPASTPERRMENKKYWSSLADLLQKLVTEATAQETEKAAKRAK